MSVDVVIFSYCSLLLQGQSSALSAFTSSIKQGGDDVLSREIVLTRQRHCFPHRCHSASRMSPLFFCATKVSKGWKQNVSSDCTWRKRASLPCLSKVHTLSITILTDAMPAPVKCREHSLPEYTHRQSIVHSAFHAVRRPCFRRVASKLGSFSEKSLLIASHTHLLSLTNAEEIILNLAATKTLSALSRI